MADKPTETLGWATTTVNETVTIGNSIVAVTNVVEPTEELKQSGLLAREPLSRPYYNYNLNYIHRWIDNLDTRTAAIGKVEMTTDAARTVTDYANEFGGTWVSHGSDTLAGQTVYVFERTA